MTFECIPALGGSKIAITFSLVKRFNKFGRTSSALPQWYSTFFISKESNIFLRIHSIYIINFLIYSLFKLLFNLASSIASGTISTPTTSFTRLAKVKPIVPVPQQMSRIIVSWSTLQMSPIFLYKTSAPLVFA